jgi:hypothetical protein
LDVDISGKVGSVQLIDGCKDRPNSILCTWDGTGWEKDPEYGPISVIDDKGIENKRWVVSEQGKSTALWTRQSAFPNREKIIGTGANMDDIGEAMAYHPPLRDKMIFLGIGILAGWLFVGPILNGMMK